MKIYIVSTVWFFVGAFLGACFLIASADRCVEFTSAMVCYWK